MGVPALAPILIGAGVGAVGSAITGKSPLKGALLGGAMGGVGSAIGAAGSAATPMGGVVGSGATATEAVSQPLAGGLLENTIAADPTMVATASGNYINPEYFAGEGIGMPVFTGNGSMMDKFTTGAQTIGENVSNIAPEYFTVDNLKGAQGLLESTQGGQRQPPPQAPSGGISRGSAPNTGASVQDLLASQQRRPKQRISLL